MGFADIYMLDGYFMVALEDYPPDVISNPLCKISVDGKAQIFPTGRNPKSPWVWRLEPHTISTIKRFLVRSDYSVRET